MLGGLEGETPYDETRVNLDLVYPFEGRTHTYAFSADKLSKIFEISTSYILHHDLAKVSD